VKISGQTLFFRASASCSKILKDKKYYNAVKIVRVNSVFQGKRKLFEILNNKKYIFNTVNSGHTVFQGKRKLLKNPERLKIFQCSEKFQGKLCFSGQAQVVQSSE